MPGDAGHSRRVWIWLILGTIALGTITALGASPARAQLVAALSNHLVAIDTGFAGTDVLLFGTTGGAGEVIVLVRGPESDTAVYRKGRKFGIWVNEADLHFTHVPGFWAIAASRPVADLLPESLVDYHQLGLRYLRLVPVEDAGQRRIAEFREALIRNKEREGLYGDNAGTVTMLGPSLFRTDLWIPGNAPIGTYTISVFLVRDQDVVGATTIPLVVGKVGFEAYVYALAHRWGLAYGLLAALAAAMAGWLASAILRRG